MAKIFSGPPAPLDGKRKLSAREASQRAKAMACLRTSKNTECHGQVHVGLFFDGTGNNSKWIEKKWSTTQKNRNKHSNIARLWDAHIDDPENGFFRFYVPGVGTPFEEIGDTNASITDYAGGGFAYMGAERICWGITSMLNAVHRYITGKPILSREQQKSLVGVISSEILSGPVGPGESLRRWGMLTVVKENISMAAQGHARKVTQINVSIFGFSRGAAQARACAHWMHEIFEEDGGAFELAGIPIRIGFLGIFDTVAAVGVGDVTPVTFGHMAWAAGTQGISSAVEECAHFIALHEQRASFPLESATNRGNVGYPGMHSDVGGGYAPGEQGKSLAAWGDSPHLSQIPLIDMHFAALKAGVPLLTIEEIRAKPEIAKGFATDAKLVTAYNQWLAANRIAPASVVEFTQAHTNQYLRWRGALHTDKSQGLIVKRFFKDSIGTDAADLLEADTNLGISLRAWRERKSVNATMVGRATERVKDVARALPMGTRIFVDAGKDPLSEHEERFLALMTEGPMPPVASIILFEDYVHDSRAGFRVLSHHEPEWLTGGYARYRNVFLQSGEDGKSNQRFNESLQAVKAAVGATVEFFQRLNNFSRETYGAARTKIEPTILRAGKNTLAAERAISEQANNAMRLYDAAQRRVLLRYIAAQRDLNDQLRERWRDVHASDRDL